MQKPEIKKNPFGDYGLYFCPKEGTAGNVAFPNWCQKSGCQWFGGYGQYEDPQMPETSVWREFHWDGSPKISQPICNHPELPDSSNGQEKFVSLGEEDKDGLMPESVLPAMSEVDLNHWFDRSKEVGGERCGPVYEDGWFDWHGGECPVGRETKVDILERGHVEFTGYAREFPWDHDDESYDIIKYRIHRPEACEYLGSYCKFCGKELG